MRKGFKALVIAGLFLLISLPLFAALEHCISIEPEPVLLGQNFTIRMSVTNNGALSVDSISPSSLVKLGTASATLITVPAPASFSLAPGANDTFTWTYNATSVGSLAYTGESYGTEQGTGIWMTSTSSCSDDYANIMGGAVLISSVSAEPINAAIGSVITVIMTVTNPGDVDSNFTQPSSLIVGGTGSVVQLSGPVPASATIAGNGGTAYFTWTYSAAGTGNVNWSGSVAGIDAVFGNVVQSAGNISENVIIGIVTPTVTPTYDPGSVSYTHLRAHET